MNALPIAVAAAAAREHAPAAFMPLVALTPAYATLGRIVAARRASATAMDATLGKSASTPHTRPSRSKRRAIGQ